MTERRTTPSRRQRAIAKAGQGLQMIGAFMVLGVCIERLTAPEALFVFVGIAILGMMMQGYGESK